MKTRTPSKKSSVHHLSLEEILAHRTAATHPQHAQPTHRTVVQKPLVDDEWPLPTLHVTRGSSRGCVS